MRALGWPPTLTIEEAIGRTLDWLEAEPAASLEERAAA